MLVKIALFWEVNPEKLPKEVNIIIDFTTEREFCGNLQTVRTMILIINGIFRIYEKILLMQLSKRITRKIFESA
ncbi:MAG: hypothetical protein HY965_04595 [Ignavibacteriales bacterium]|nr:hypothetical protein [Ignavibacteriales bacterium]